MVLSSVPEKGNEIIGGPSLMGLMFGLFDRDHSDPRVVTFTTKTKNPSLTAATPFKTVVGLVIDQVGVEDGSGHNWIVEGWIHSMNGSRYQGSHRASRLRLYYNSNTRKGAVLP